MCAITRFVGRIRALFGRHKMKAELAEELRFHLESEINKNIAAGMSPEEGRYPALRLFGGVRPCLKVPKVRTGPYS